MQEERWEIIYNQINGLNEPDVCEWARDESGELDKLIDRIYRARDRLCGRLGVDPDADPDLELLISGLEDFARTCGRLMYQYGYQDGVDVE